MVDAVDVTMAHNLLTVETQELVTWGSELGLKPHVGFWGLKHVMYLFTGTKLSQRYYN